MKKGIFLSSILMALFTLGCDLPDKGSMNLKWVWDSNANVLKLNLGVSEGLGKNIYSLYQTQYTSSTHFKGSVKQVLGGLTEQVGLIFGATDDSHFYSLLVNRSGLVTILKLSGTTSTTYKDGELDSDVVTTLGSENIIECWISGTTIYYAINGGSTKSISDGTISSGGTLMGFLARISNASDEKKFEAKNLTP